MTENVGMRKRYYQKDNSGEIIYTQVEESHIGEDGIPEQVVTEEGLTIDQFINLLSLEKDILALQHQRIYDTEQNRIYDKDVERQILRDQQDIKLQKADLYTRMYEIEEKLGVQKKELWLQCLRDMEKAARDRIELEIQGRQLILDREKLEADIGKAELQAMIDYKRLQQDWFYKQASLELRERELTKDEKAESYRLLLEHDRLEHDKARDNEHLDLKKEEMSRAWEELELEKQREGWKLYYQAKHDDRMEREFQHKMQVDNDTLALKQRCEERLEREFAWTQTKEGTELELEGKRLTLDQNRFAWQRQVDTEELRQGRENIGINWAHVDLREHELTQREQEAFWENYNRMQEIELEKEEQSRKERATDHQIAHDQQALEQERELEEKKLDRRDREIGIRDRETRIKGFSAIVDAADKARGHERQERQFQHQVRDDKAQRTLELAGHRERVRHNLTSEAQEERSLRNETLSTLSEIKRNEASKLSGLANAYKHKAEGDAELLGEARRTEQMRRSEDRRDKESEREQDREDKKLEIQREKIAKYFEARMAEIRRKKGRDQREYAVKVLREMIKSKHIDKKYQLEAKRLNNELMKTGIKEGAGIINNVINLLGTVVKTAGKVVNNTVSTVGRVGEQALK